MTYDQWKTRDPNDTGFYDMPEDDGPTELDLAYAEIERLQDAKRRALAIADERSKENVLLRNLLKEARQYVSDSGDDEDGECRQLSEELRADIDAVLGVVGSPTECRQMSDLLPCPFCGCTDIMEGVYFAHGELEKRGAVRCANCGVRAPTPSWNNRVPGLAQGRRDPDLDNADQACQELCSRYGFATGHGDTITTMVKEIDAQIGERLVSMSAQAPASPPDGWVLVPKEPTDKMCEAMLERIEDAESGRGAPFKWPDIEHMFDVYTDAIAAAPVVSSTTHWITCPECNGDCVVFPHGEGCSKCDGVGRLAVTSTEHS